MKAKCRSCGKYFNNDIHPNDRYIEGPLFCSEKCANEMAKKDQALWNAEFGPAGGVGGNNDEEKNYEEQVIEFEAARNKAMDDYFNARQGLTRTRVQERIFEAGFRMAWHTRNGENDE